MSFSLGSPSLQRDTPFSGRATTAGTKLRQMEALFDTCKQLLADITRCCLASEVYSEECLKMAKYVAKCALVLSEVELRMHEEQSLRGGWSTAGLIRSPGQPLYHQQTQAGWQPHYPAVVAQLCSLCNLCTLSHTPPRNRTRLFTPGLPCPPPTAVRQAKHARTEASPPSRPLSPLQAARACSWLWMAWFLRSSRCCSWWSSMRRLAAAGCGRWRTR